MIKRALLIIFLFGTLSSTANASTAAVIHRALVKRVHGDLNHLRDLVFDIEKVRKYGGMSLQFYRRGSIASERIFRPMGTLRQPYSNIEYEVRSDGAWVELTLAIDRKHCLTPDDLNSLYPMGEGVPRTCDHCAGNDFEVGFGNEDNSVWIVYSKESHATCARQFIIEA